MDTNRLLQRPARTRVARLLLELIPAQRLAGAMLGLTAERLAAAEGLTSALAEVLEAVARARSPATVSGLARALGYARQSVQRTADLLVAQGFCAYRKNPGHKRAPLLEPTEKGTGALERLEAARISWANQASLGLDAEALRQVAVILRQIAERRD